jgi:hypothetical protein
MSCRTSMGMVDMEADKLWVNVEWLKNLLAVLVSLRVLLFA